MMNTAKKSNLLFLIVVLCYILGSGIISLLSAHNVEVAVLPSLIFSQLLIFVPGMIFLLIFTKNSEFKMFKGIKIPSAVLMIFIAELIIPIASAVNVFSQLFTENKILSVSEDITALPFAVSLMIIGILGPLNEEFVFRGIIFNGLLKKSDRIVMSAVASALFFGLMHMNLNQAMYAFVLGLIFALIDYSLDSIIPSVICHCIINSQNVAALYVISKAQNLFGDSALDMPELDAIYSGGAYGKLFLLAVFAVLMVTAVFSTAIAAVLLYVVCSIDKKTERLKRIVKKPEPSENGRERLIYITGVIAIILCLFFIFLYEPMLKFIDRF